MQGVTVAADWGVLPEGTIVRIQGVSGEFTVEDTGSAVHGKHIDVYVSTEHAAIDWGVKRRVVRVIKWGRTTS